MALADILNTNPQDFVMEAYADPLQYFEPDPPNETKPEEVLAKLKSNDSSTKDVCLNNLGGISEKMMCDIFDALRNNDQLTKLSAVNCDISDFAIQTLCSALDQNGSLKSLSVENNRVTPDTIADLFESIASPNNGLLELRVACQAQESMGNRVEGRIADAIMKNPRLMKVGITLEFQEVMERVSKHLISNMDKMRIKRLNDGVAPEPASSGPPPVPSTNLPPDWAHFAYFHILFSQIFASSDFCCPVCLQNAKAGVH